MSAAVARAPSRRGGSLRDALLALALGAATVLGFAPFHLYPLPLLTLAWLVRRWQRAERPGQAFLVGYAFGIGFFLAGVSWVYVSLHDYGGMPAALAVVATLLFCAYLALYPALAGAVHARLRCDSLWRDSLLAAGAWTLTEWLRGWVLTGFPWLALGTAQSPPSPLAGFAPIIGAYGISFLTVLLAAWIGLAWKRGKRVIWAASSLVLVLTLGAVLGSIAWTRPFGTPLRVSLLQGSIEQSMKWRPELLRQSLDGYLALARRYPAELTILPETALPMPLDQVPGDYLHALAATLAAGGNVIFGAVARDEQGRYYNSAVSFGAAPSQRYDKVHLVPFGEFTPPAFSWTLAVLSIPMSNFSRGADEQPPLRLNGQRIAINICYEDVFGAEIIRALPQATLLVNLSNTAWFGNSLAQPQHLQIAQLRALETGRTMLRATNTGMTAVVNADGVVTHRLPPFTAAGLQATVQGYSGATPYVRWGNAAVLAIVAAALLLAFGRRRRRGIRSGCDKTK